MSEDGHPGRVDPEVEHGAAGDGVTALGNRLRGGAENDLDFATVASSNLDCCEVGKRKTGTWLLTCCGCWSAASAAAAARENGP